MDFDGYKADAAEFKKLSSQGNQDHLALLADAIRNIRKEQQLKNLDNLLPVLQPYARLLEMPLDLGDSENPINYHLTQWKKGKLLGPLPIFLAWLAAEHTEVARAAYDAAGVKFRPFSAAKPIPDLIQFEAMGRNSRPIRYAVDPRSIAGVIARTISATVDIPSQRRIFIVGFAVLAVAILITFAIADQNNEARSSADEERTDRLLELAEFRNDIKLEGRLPVQSQIELMQLRADASPNDSQWFSTLSVLRSFWSQEMAYLDAVRAADRSPNDPDILLRRTVVGMIASQPLDIDEEIATIQRAAAETGADGFGGVQTILEFFDNPSDFVEQNHDEALEEVWQSALMLREPLTREYVLLNIAATAVNIGEDDLAHRLVTYLNDCATNTNRVVENVCILIKSYLIYAEEGEQESRIYSENIMNRFREGNEPDMFAVELLSTTNRIRGTGNENWREAISYLQERIGYVREAGSDAALFDLLRLATDTLYYFPASSPENAYPFAREAFQLAEAQLDHPLLERGNFLQTFARLESSLGDPELAIDIQTHLIERAATDDFLYLAALHSERWHSLTVADRPEAELLAEKALLVGAYTGYFDQNCWSTTAFLSEADEVDWRRCEALLREAAIRGLAGWSVARIDQLFAYLPAQGEVASLRPTHWFQKKANIIATDYSRAETYSLTELQLEWNEYIAQSGFNDLLISFFDTTFNDNEVSARLDTVSTTNILSHIYNNIDQGTGEDLITRYYEILIGATLADSTSSIEAESDAELDVGFENNIELIRNGTNEFIYVREEIIPVTSINYRKLIDFIRFQQDELIQFQNPDSFFEYIYLLGTYNVSRSHTVASYSMDSVISEYCVQMNEHGVRFYSHGNVFSLFYRDTCSGASERVLSWALSYRSDYENFVWRSYYGYMVLNFWNYEDPEYLQRLGNWEAFSVEHNLSCDICGVLRNEIAALRQ